jgi:hypothetical protein
MKAVSMSRFSTGAHDKELLEIVYEESVKNAELKLIHLRDARNILHAIPDLRDNSPLSKAAILLSAAALESDLIYMAGIALRFIEARPEKFDAAHSDFVRGFEESIDDNGRIVRKRRGQTLTDRMSLLPSILARTIDRHYHLSKSSASASKMRRTIARRDAIVHPRWETYVPAVGWWEAAEAVDAVELYLHSVEQCLFPNMIGYSSMLWTIKGPHKDDMGIGYRTFGKRGPNRPISSMAQVGVAKVLLSEWCDSMFMTNIALDQGTERDSEGSMLTRSALVVLYAMLDAQLAVISQWKMKEHGTAFTAAERLFLSEAAVGIGHDGEMWVEGEQHPFKKARESGSSRSSAVCHR